MSRGFRTESDPLGEVQVPANRYWGAQTERARHHFKIGDELMPAELIRAMAIVKKAAAIVNLELKLLAPAKAGLIQDVCDEIIAGDLDEHFPLGIWQSGSGTQTNMNLNEVIANRAIEKAGGVLGSKRPIHPNDDVNCSQSTNDVFPTAMHIAIASAVRTHLQPHLTALYEDLARKANEWHSIVKVGRTHLMDAAPLTLGQEFSGYASQIKHAIQAIEHAMGALSEIALGGTAVGTGLNAPPSFAKKTAEAISAITGFQFTSASNKFEALASHEPILALSGALRQTAAALMKISTDIRWSASGPRCSIAELILPENEPGSSIMPGKVNPTQCEAMAMICVQVMGNDTAIEMACALGNFELNVFKPLLIRNILQSIHLLADAVGSFLSHCVAHIRPNLERIAFHLSRSLMPATALTVKIGYDKAAEVVKLAHADNLSLKEAALKLGVLTEKQFDEIVDPRKMI